MNNKKRLELIKIKAKFYAKEIWGLDFNLDIIINNRLKETFANYICYLPEARIEINKKLLNK